VRRLILLALLAWVPQAAAATSTVTTADQQLADRYAPILMLKRQSAPCNTDGEQFMPAPVEIVLGNPDVHLVRGPSGGQSGFKTIADGPTTAQVAGLGRNYYLDLPGDPIHPGCTYEQDSKRLMEGKKPTAYAHIAGEPGVPGIALQYWFFWWFNQFNDLHEGDWEMIQLVWDDAATVDDALARPPTRVALAQHGGGEITAWTDARLHREGDHPVVYPAAGSHATYYDAQLYLGTGQNGSGFGCDDSRAPSDRVAVSAVAVPDAPDVGSSFGWLTYDGKWGEYEPALNNGPDGALQHSQWREPFRWMDGLRTSSPTVPGGDTFGPSVTSSFCTVIAKLSLFYNKLSRKPLLLVGMVAAFVVLAIVGVRRTVWSPAPPTPLDQRRRGGQILVASARLYAERWRRFLALGAVFIPISFVSAWVQHILFVSTGLKTYLDAAASDRTTAVVALLLGSFGTALAYTLVVALVAAALGARLEGRQGGPRDAVRGLIRHLRPLVGAQLRVTLGLALLCLSLVGIPLAVKKAVDWTFTPYEVTVRNRSGRGSLRSSTALVRGDWWNTAGFTIALVGLTLSLGPLVGYAMLFLTSAPLELIDIFGSLVYTLVVPYTGLALGLLWLELGHREEPQPAGQAAAVAP
jgi:hypothetical protein